MTLTRPFHRTPRDYLMAEQPDEPVLFPATFNHAWVAEGLKPLKPKAAGFVAWDSDRPVCFGKSEGLRLSGRGEADAALIAGRFSGLPD